MLARRWTLVVRARFIGVFAIALLGGIAIRGQLAAAQDSSASSSFDPDAVAASIKIFRDSFGVPHIDGPTDTSVVFGLAYCQAEDYFWQIEDSYILGIGRYSEIYGRKGLNSDLLNRAFEIVPSAKRDEKTMEPELAKLAVAYTAGLNYFLAKNPEVKPRLIEKFEPWMVLAFGRQLILEMGFRYTRLTEDFMPRSNGEIWTAQASTSTNSYHEEFRQHVGSNAWAVSPSRTKSKHAMLFINPHQPWFGFGQFYEAHMRSGEGWNFTGATFFGNPMLALGHNEYLGWAFTVNEPDIADVWRETFDDPNNPLAYRYDGGYRIATEWKDTVRIKKGTKFEDKVYTFRKTHHGPIVAKENDTTFLSANIAKLYEANLLRQVMKLVRAKNVDEFKAGMSLLNFQFMNTVYADRDGNIFYLYNGIIPRREPGHNWSKPVDGSSPKTEWNGYHEMSELPQVLNPPSGFVQSCNSSPFTVTDDGNAHEMDFPPYMAEDKYDDKRRAKMSRHLLRQMHDVTFEEWQMAAFDTTLYWPMTELPRFKEEFEALKETNPKLAKQVQPYLEHLLDWDYRGGNDSTQATLCYGWYEELYGFGYPAEKLKQQFVNSPEAKFKALITAAGKIKALFGDWKMPWGEIYRIQRHADVADFFDIPFNDKEPSLPSPGLPGTMGVANVAYYTPSVSIPLVREMKKHYGVVGNTYMCTVEFGPRVQGASLTQFGSSGHPDSPHFIDQAKLLSESRLKPELFYWEDVEAQAKFVYRPGEKPQAVAQAAK